MAETHVFQSVTHAAGQHPYWVVGGVGGLVVFLWLLSGKKAQAGGQQFSFSYGPSDAQVKAGTALAISQAADQTAVSLANIGATTQLGQAGINAGTAQSYFNYLTTNSANGLAATQSTNGAATTIQAGHDYATAHVSDNTLAGLRDTNATAFSVAGINANVKTIQSANDVAIAGINATGATQIAGINANRDTGIAGINANRDTSIAGIDANNALQMTTIVTNASNFQKGYDYAAAIHQQDTNLGIANAQITAGQTVDMASIIGGQRIQLAQIDASKPPSVGQQLLGKLLSPLSGIFA